MDVSRVQATDAGNPHERLRFAQSWLKARRETPLPPEAVTANDRVAYLWSLHGAHEEFASAQLLVGHCYREGRGVGRHIGRAQRWYRAAAEQGSTEAAYWLKQTGADASAWLLRGGGPLRLWLGWALLLSYLVWSPWRFAPGAVAVYLFIACIGQLLVRRLLNPNRVRTAPSADAQVGDQLVEGLARRPWRTLQVAGEDGLVLVPLLVLGAVTGTALWVAPVAGLLFGLLHRPLFSWRGCVGKGVSYALATAVVLPWGGVAAMALGHVLLDGLLVGLRIVTDAHSRRIAT